MGIVDLDPLHETILSIYQNNSILIAFDGVLYSDEYQIPLCISGSMLSPLTFRYT